MALQCPIASTYGVAVTPRGTGLRQQDRGLLVTSSSYWHYGVNESTCELFQEVRRFQEMGAITACHKGELDLKDPLPHSVIPRNNLIRTEPEVALANSVLGAAASVNQIPVRDHTEITPDSTW